MRNTTLKDWYDSLPSNIQTSKRLEIMEKCGRNEKTFYRWRSGETMPSKLEREAINLIANQELEYVDFTAELLEELNMVKQ